MRAGCRWIIKDPRTPMEKRGGVKIEERDPYFKPHPCGKKVHDGGLCSHHFSIAIKNPNFKNWLELQRKLRHQQEQNTPTKFKNYYWKKK